jgi:hypothetical protein
VGRHTVQEHLGARQQTNTQAWHMMYAVHCIKAPVTKSRQTDMQPAGDSTLAAGRSTDMLQASCEGEQAAKPELQTRAILFTPAAPFAGPQ